MNERVANIPDYRLTVDGEDITSKVRPRLMSLSLTEKRGGEADQLDLILDDSDGRLAIPRKGAEIRLQLGWLQGADVRPGLVDKGRFKVDQARWSGPPDQLRITARSADLTGAFRARRERGHRATTLGAIVRLVAAANNLQPVIAASLDRIAVPMLAQHQQSDMALLRRLGREHDAIATIKDGRLIFAPIGAGTTVSGRALRAVTITPADGDRYEFGEIDRSAEAGVEARWHDQDSGQRKTVKVGAGGGKARRLRKTYHNEAEARAAARAEAGRARRAEAEFSIDLAFGRPDLLPKTPVTLAGFKPQADQRRWIVAELAHRLDKAGGLVTALKLETR